MLALSSLIASSDQAGNEGRVSLPVRVELYEDMGKPKKPARNKSAKEAAELSPINDTTAYSVYEGVRGLGPHQVPDRVYQTPAFGFYRLPSKYDETGVRVLPKGPIVFRATAELALRPGEHRFVIRSREDAVFSVDGEVVAKIETPQIPSDGHNPVQALPELIAPNLKEFAPGNSERVFTFHSDGRSRVFTLETVVGRGGRRPDLGALAVAVAGPGDEAFALLGSMKEKVFSDTGWATYKREEDDRLIQVDARERRERSFEESRYWQLRHAYARKWVEGQEPVAMPEIGKGMPARNAIDHFVGRRIETAALRRMARDAEERVARAEGRVLFHADIQPILKTHCMKCHGDQEKGGLRLDSRFHALRGGESEEPAIVAGDPEKSLMIEMIAMEDMPPKGELLDEKEFELLSRWIEQGAVWEEFSEEPVDPSLHPTLDDMERVGLAPQPPTDDLDFLRRLSLDTVGVIPTVEEIRSFLADDPSERRGNAIDRLLGDPRWADHWVPFWQDLLAENPNIVKPNLNNTGAFRWWIHEAFLDNKPMDRFVTDLARLRGDSYIGPAGFGIATQNDAPMAAKAHILGAAFMGVEMKCARCHDAPYQSVTQKDLFSLAAMLEGEPVKVPATSLVPEDKLEGRNALVQVNLKPNEAVLPEWPFEPIGGARPLPAKLVRYPDDSRDALAVRLTSPANPRFAKTIVNWVWKRYFGKGLVEPAIDWENADISHPRLLDYLAQELVGNGYDLKHVSRLIFNSDTYQRGVLETDDAEAASLFAGHARRRMTAEQIVDSVHLATDRRLESEELNMDQDGRRPINQFINLGQPKRAWEFTSLSNERDRPSLTLPGAQVYVDVLEAFGWNGSRQNPVYERDHATNMLQPAAMANGVMSQRLTRLSDEHPLTELAARAESSDELVETLFLKTLGRSPDADERAAYLELLSEGFRDRVVPEAERAPLAEKKRYPFVTWSNHLQSRANEIKEEIARDIEAGEPPTRLLRDEWRQNLEDGLWALLNSPEMIFIP